MDIKSALNDSFTGQKHVQNTDGAILFVSGQTVSLFSAHRIRVIIVERIFNGQAGRNKTR